MPVALAGESNSVLLRAFSEALNLVEEGAIEDAENLLRCHLSTFGIKFDMDAPLARKSLSVARDLVKQGCPSIAVQIYRICVQSGVALGSVTFCHWGSWTMVLLRRRR